jgi:hypothetical protein
MYGLYQHDNLSKGAIETRGQNVLVPEDKRALNVLFHFHINPYGLFPLDLTKRLGITVDVLEIDSYDEDEAIIPDEVYEKLA